MQDCPNAETHLPVVGSQTSPEGQEAPVAVQGIVKSLVSELPFESDFLNTPTSTNTMSVTAINANGNIPNTNAV